MFVFHMPPPPAAAQRKKRAPIHARAHSQPPPAFLLARAHLPLSSRRQTSSMAVVPVSVATASVSLVGIQAIPWSRLLYAHH